MKLYKNYWQQPSPQPTQPPFQQYHYDAKYRVEVSKFLGKLYKLFHKYLPKECIDQIEHQEIKFSLGGEHYICGFTKNYNNKVARRYLMDKDGIWYETPNLMNWWVNLGFEVNDDTLEAFAFDIQTEYYLKEIDKK